MLWALEKDKRRNIERLIEKYIAEDGRYPVNILSLIGVIERITGLKIKIEYIDMYAFGSIKIKGDLVTICLKSRAGRPMKRLAFGHEIAHLFSWLDESGFLKKEFSFFERYVEDRRANERICDQIGMHILCPIPKVKQVINRGYCWPFQFDLFNKREPLVTIKALAHFFMVPIGSLRHHLRDNLGVREIQI